MDANLLAEMLMMQLAGPRLSARLPYQPIPLTISTHPH